MSDQYRHVPERVWRSGAMAAASSRLVEAIRSTETAATVSDPARGQLWRILWDDAAQLVLVLRAAGSGSAMAAPVTTDPPASDESSVVLDADLTVLGHSATIWGGLTKGIPLMVFDLLIGNVASAIVDAVESVAAGSNAEALPDGVSAGTRVTSPFDPSAEIRAELSDTLDRLRDATWAPPTLGPAQPLRDLLRDRPGLPALMEALAEALQVGLPTVMSIVMGKRPVTPGEASVIAQVTGLTEQQVLSAVPPLPADLVSELNHPRWRRAVRALRRPGEFEAATRLTIAYGTLALAARQTGPASAPSWPQRIHQYLATQLSDRRDR